MLSFPPHSSSLSHFLLPTMRPLRSGGPVEGAGHLLSLAPVSSLSGLCCGLTVQAPSMTWWPLCTLPHTATHCHKRAVQAYGSASLFGAFCYEALDGPGLSSMGAKARAGAGLGPVWAIVVGGLEVDQPRGSRAPSLLDAGGRRVADGRPFLVVMLSLATSRVAAWL